MHCTPFQIGLTHWSVCMTGGAPQWRICMRTMLNVIESVRKYMNAMLACTVVRDILNQQGLSGKPTIRYGEAYCCLSAQAELWT